MIKYINLSDFDVKHFKSNRKFLFFFSGNNEFLRYFCYLSIRKQLSKYYDKICTKTYNLLQDAFLQNTYQSHNLFSSIDYEAKFTSFFSISDSEEKILKSLLNFIAGRLHNSKETTMEVYYLDDFNAVKDYLNELNIDDFSFVIDLQKYHWDDLKNIIKYFFVFFDIVPTALMLERSYITFLPTNFYDLFTILKILEFMDVDKNNPSTFEKVFLELVKNVNSKRSFKYAIKKDLKHFFYWKENNLQITNNNEWKSFIRYKVSDILEEDLCKELKIDDRLQWWNNLLDDINDVDLRAVKDNVSNSMYNLNIAVFGLNYYK